MEVLATRYPRFVETIHLSPASTLTPKVRLSTWLMRLIEDIYNSLSECFNAAHIIASSSPARSSTALTNKLVMPYLAQRFVHHSLGLRELADQECLDLILNVEYRREQFPEVAMFSLFLRELLDEDRLLFFLWVRKTLQQDLDVSLASKEKRAHTSTLGKKYARGELMYTRNHPLVPDGTQQLLLSKMACEQVLESVFATSDAMSSRLHSKVHTSGVVLAQYLIRVKYNTIFVSEHGQLVTLEDFMAALMQTFEDIDDDITAVFKYNDDGESLSGLVRLRDTITSESRIKSLTLAYSEQEKSLRNLRIDQIRMERNNADNRYRVDLRLLQHRIHLQEQELEHIMQQITTAQETVDNTWKDVIKKNRPHSEQLGPSSRGLANISSANGIEKELASVLGRFVAYVAKMYQRHSITLKAASVIATPWQRQVEEYRLQMVIRIQRVYRSRKRAREIKLEARDKIKEQIRERDQRLRNDQIEQQRLEAQRMRDLDRHQQRIKAKQEQEVKLKAEKDARQKVIVDRVRENKMAQMQIERNRNLVSRMCLKWRQFVGGRLQKRKANAMFMRFTLLKWKRHFSAYKKADSAVRRIQHWLHRRQEIRRLRKEMRYQAKRNGVAKKYLKKVQYRLLVRLFNHWALVAERQNILRANFSHIVQKRERFWLQRWLKFVSDEKLERDTAVRLVQRLYRGRLARRMFQYLFRRNKGAVDIQRVFRGHRGRKTASTHKAIKMRQDYGCASILKRYQLHLLGECLWELHHYAHVQQRIKAIETRRIFQRKLNTLASFVFNVDDEVATRVAIEQRRHGNATRIQRQFRRYTCQLWFREEIRLHRAARSIQRVFRGFQGRRIVSKYLWEINAARMIQTVWRRHRARIYVTSLRIEKILTAAFRGDYAVVKRAIAGGYWYAADLEGNSILHTAAAAGHKRIVKLCLRCSFDVNAVNHRFQTPLHLVLANLPPKQIVFAGNPEFDDEDPGNQVRRDMIALAEYMIEHGAWHEAADELGLTPLLLSTSLGHADAVEMLLDRGANTEARTLVGQLNATQLAVEGNHFETLKVLLASQAFDPMVRSSSSQQYETYDDADLYTDPPHLWLLLHVCAGRGLLECLRVLLDHMQLRVDSFPVGTFDRRDREGYTPLIYAVSSAYTSVVQILLERGATPDTKDYFGRAPLHIVLQPNQSNNDDGITSSSATIAARGEIVKLLTMFDADVNVKDTDGDAPLHMSCQSDNFLSCTSILLTSGAVLVANALGNQPTHVAAQCGAVSTLRLLLDYGGDMNLKNYAGKTPLGVARMYRQLDIVEFVLEYYAQEAIELESADDDDSKVLDQKTVDTERTEEPEGSDEEDTSVIPLQERTPEQWARALQSAFRMDTLAEWTMFIDESTGVAFYARIGSMQNLDFAECSWEPSVEFDAALGGDWEIVRCPPGWIPPASSPTSHINTGEHDHRRGGLSATIPQGFVTRSSTSRTEYKYLYHHRVTGELRAHVPPVNLEMLQDVVQRSKKHQMLLRARVRRVQGGENEVSASAVEYLRFQRTFANESAQARAEHQAAISIQRTFRARRTLRLVRLLLLQNRKVVGIQRAFRARHARIETAKLNYQHLSAAKIQALWRGVSTRKREFVGGAIHTERVRVRYRRRAARTIQKMFRGYCGRRFALLEALRSHSPVLHQRFASLPFKPPKSVVEWQKLCSFASKRRSYMIWDEFRTPRSLLYLTFYCHQVTRVCSWEPPALWKSHDYDEFLQRRQLWAWGYTNATVVACQVLQRLWRARVARISLRAVLSAVRLMRRCERAYLEEPTSLVALGNYVLFLHAVTHDYERARPLFARLIRAMAQRGPDVPFILFAYAIFAYITQEADARETNELISRAKVRDPKIASFQVALLGFFRPQVLVNPQKCEANINYAACLQWLVVSDAVELQQLETAQEYYMCALAADPRRRGAMELLQDLLDRKRVLIRKQRPPRRNKASKTKADEDNDTGFDGHEVFRQWQALQAAREDYERAQQLLVEQETESRRVAAIKIQARYRRRRAERQTRKLQLEIRKAAALAEQTKERAVHDCVSRAFDRVGANSTSKKGPALSLPIKQVELVLSSIVDAAGSSQLVNPAMLAAQFTRAHRGKHFNVLDICHLVHEVPELEAAIVGQ